MGNPLKHSRRWPLPKGSVSVMRSFYCYYFIVYIVFTKVVIVFFVISIIATVCYGLIAYQMNEKHSRHWPLPKGSVSVMRCFCCYFIVIVYIAFTKVTVIVVDSIVHIRCPTEFEIGLIYQGKEMRNFNTD